MKVAFIKQELDTFGPINSFCFNQVNENGLMRYWPSKAAMWETTNVFKADWYIVPQQKIFPYTYDSVLSNNDVIKNIQEINRNIFEIKDIPFEKYDLVISADPIPNVPNKSKTLFAYHNNEHWDVYYNKSLKKVLFGYDIFLDHMFSSKREIKTLPAVVSFPFDVRGFLSPTFFKDEKKEKVHVDWRTIVILSNNNPNKTKLAIKNLEEYLGIKVSYYEQSSSLYSPVKYLFGDCLEYLKTIASNKYYISVGRNSGPGQGLVDAASLGLICIGDKTRPYHKLLCHPEMLAYDLVEIIIILKRLSNNKDYQDEMLSYQSTCMKKWFIDYPIEILNKAILLKKK